MSRKNICKYSHQHCAFPTNVVRFTLTFILRQTCQSVPPRVPDTSRNALIALYSVIAILGFIANIALLGAFFRNKVRATRLGRHGIFTDARKLPMYIYTYVG